MDRPRSPRSSRAKKRKIDDYNALIISIEKFLILVIVPIILIITIYPFILWMASENIEIQPFTIGEISGRQDFSGKPIADLLYFELQRIDDLCRLTPQYNPNQTGSALNVTLGTPTTIVLNTPTPENWLKPSPNIVTDRIYSIGNIGMVGTSLPFGPILIFLKNHYNPTPTITGSIQQYGDKLSIVANFADSKSFHEGDKTWELRQTNLTNNSSIKEQIPAMVEDLAFQIEYTKLCNRNQMHDIGYYPETWQALKNVTLGWEAYRTYESTGDLEYLNKASRMAQSAKSSRPCYLRDCLLDVLATIWINKGNALASLGKPNESIEAYNKAIELSL